MDEINAALAAFDRPRMGTENVKALFANIKAQAEWDAANPEKAAQRAALLEEYEALEGAARKAQLAELDEKRIAERLKESGCGERSMAVAAAPTESEALAAARRWLVNEKDRWCLTLQGNVGNGKSVAAAWCLRQAARVHSVRWRQCSEVTKMSSYGPDAADFAKLKSVRLLVLDEVGAEHLTDNARSLLSELLNARYEGSLRTVLTANLDEKTLEARLGRRIFDRIRHGGRWVELKGKSMRGDT